MMIEPAIEIFKNYIKKTNQRFTQEKRLILTEILSTKEHFDVESLFIKMRNKGYNVSKASIYRLIPHLIKIKLIREVSYESGPMKYEQILGSEHHGHFFCKVCKKIYEFNDEEIRELMSKIKGLEGFVVDEVDLKVTGICRHCNSKGR